MAIARSKLTSEGRVSVPAEVCHRLGLVSGSMIEWDEQDGAVVVRRVAKFTSEDIHVALFGMDPPKARSAEEQSDGVRRHLKAKHAR